MENSDKVVRYRVAPNIALIKYWGKFDDDLILPLNSNISVTLDVVDIYTETVVEVDPLLKEDVLILNGK
jgi:diphosphomevalonate decarboxylase